MADLYLKIAESPSPELVIEKYSSARFPEFRDLFAHRDWEAKHPLQHLLRKPDEDQVSLVLHNMSSRDVTILAFRWTFPETPGHLNVSKKATNSYEVDIFSAVLTGGESALVSPLSDSVKESLLAHVKAGGGIMGGHFSSNRDPELPEHGEIGFALDLVGFDDGEIAGPDPDRYATKVQCRKHAGEYVARQIRRAVNEQRDPKPVLDALIELPRKRDDQYIAWVTHFARDYLSGENRPWAERRLDRMENLLAPPQFFRKEGNQSPSLPLAP